MNTRNKLTKVLSNSILVLDGAMGTMLQAYKFTEDDYHHSSIPETGQKYRGNNELLNISHPEAIKTIHEKYILAGADIIETNTFNGNAISQADFGLQDVVYKLNYNGAKLAREVADRYINKGRPVFVSGSMGPTNQTASMSPDVANPEFRKVTYKQLFDAYLEQAKALVDGGVDLLLIETIFDTLNAKAAVSAILELNKQRSIDVPIMISGTISDASGRTLSGQTLEAFYIALEHANPISIGLNCAMGAEQLTPFVEQLSKLSAFHVSAHPNAGLPNELGEYDQSAQEMAEIIGNYAKNGWVNIVGGCCGTRPVHIEAIANVVKFYKPRIVPQKKYVTKLSGLEPVNITSQINFVNIGERTNVAGSRKFARLIRENKMEEAIEIARNQVENGAQIIDICMDDAMLDAEVEIVKFLNLLATEPNIARVPFMVDSSNWNAIEVGLQCVQGKSIVNSISLKEGDDLFIEKASKVKSYGAAVVVMLFDENGQADTFKRKIEVAKRSYDLLVDKVDFNPSDIIFDPNILAIGTGIKQHNNYAVDFIKACEWIKQNLPYVKISGGISNLSFSFRGNNPLREAIHSVFLYHAIKAGLDMGIVNPSSMKVYDDIDPDLLLLTEDLVLNKRADATDRLMIFAENLKDDAKQKEQGETWRKLLVEERLQHALLKGISTYIHEDLDEIIPKFDRAVNIIDGPLMQGMSKVGDLFGQGRMFLPQVVKTARVMKIAVDYLEPIIKNQDAKSGVSGKKGLILLATVKGDVHDIGKNIVQVVLSCNNYDIIDLGVMVSSDVIIKKAIEHNVDIIGLSGLITPSLEEMADVARKMQQHNMTIPLLIGGATTSKIHTAVKIAHEYCNSVINVKDASQSVSVCNLLMSAKAQEYKEQISQEYKLLNENYISKKTVSLKSFDKACENKLKIKFKTKDIGTPKKLGVSVFKNVKISDITPYIDWSFYFKGWQLKGLFPKIFDDPVNGKEARKLYDYALKMLHRIEKDNLFNCAAVIGLFPAASQNENILVYDENKKSITLKLPQLRNQEDKFEPNLSLADFIAPLESKVDDYIGMFTVTGGLNLEETLKLDEFKNNDFDKITLKLLADRLAEALAEYMHLKVRTEFWGYSKSENLPLHSLLMADYQGIRPAYGYPACPDHGEKENIFKILNVEENIGVTLTENMAMMPTASVCGLYFAHPQSKYFRIGKINYQQIDAYSKQKDAISSNVVKFLNSNDIVE